MRIYYCGWRANSPLAQLAEAATNKRPKRCGDTAYYRCRCGEIHYDAPGGRREGEPLADHPKFLCHKHHRLVEEGSDE